MSCGTSAKEERTEADEYDEVLDARVDRWKSKICQSSQLRQRQADEKSRFCGKGFKKRESVRRIKKRRMLDLIGLDEVSTGAFAKANDAEEGCPSLSMEWPSMASAVSSGTCPSPDRATDYLGGKEALGSDITKEKNSTLNRGNWRSSPSKKNAAVFRAMLLSILIAPTGKWQSGEAVKSELRKSYCTIPDKELICKRSFTTRKHGGKDWSRDELHRSSDLLRYDNRSKDSRPLPKEQIVRQGMHPNPGPDREHQSRGQREAVLGKQAGIEDAYDREPMSSLVAALNTKRTIDDVINARGEAKQITADGNDNLDARIPPAPRRCIQVRNGTIDEQREHRSGCQHEQCIAAFRVHGLWAERTEQEAKRCRRMQSTTNSNGLNPHATKFIPSEMASTVGSRRQACISSGCMSLQCEEPMAGSRRAMLRGAVLREVR